MFIVFTSDQKKKHLNNVIKYLNNVIYFSTGAFLAFLITYLLFKDRESKVYNILKERYDRLIEEKNKNLVFSAKELEEKDKKELTEEDKKIKPDLIEIASFLARESTRVEEKIRDNAKMEIVNLLVKEKKQQLEIECRRDGNNDPCNILLTSFSSLECYGELTCLFKSYLSLTDESIDKSKKLMDQYTEELSNLLEDNIRLNFNDRIDLKTKNVRTLINYLKENNQRIEINSEEDYSQLTNLILKPREEISNKFIEKNFMKFIKINN